MRIGPKMLLVVKFVRENPGLPMQKAALAVCQCQSVGYDTIHRCIKAGLIYRKPGPVTSSWLLYVREKTDGT